MKNEIKKCSIEGCEKNHHSKGLCRNHRREEIRHQKNQWNNFKYPLKSDFEMHLTAKRLREKRKIIDKRKLEKAYSLTEKQQFIFLAIMFADKDKCWLWPYGKRFKKSYIGCEKINYKNKKWSPPRLSLTLFKGESTTERNECAHDPVICNNSLCVNPLHLRWASRQENVDDMHISGTTPEGIRNGRSILTDKQVINILSDPRSQTKIAKDYNVSISTIHLIKTGKRWKHIPRPQNKPH